MISGIGSTDRIGTTPCRLSRCQSSPVYETEQIRYLQALWDRIAETPGEVPVPRVHLEIAERRLAKYRRNRRRVRSAHEVLDRLV